MLNADSIRRARYALDAREPPEHVYFVYRAWVYRQGQGFTEFSEDGGSTWNTWDEEHPACKWFAEHYARAA